MEHLKKINMKKVIFILLVLFGLQTKAQNTNWCDSIQILGGFVDNLDSDPIHVGLFGWWDANVTWQVSAYGNNWYDVEYTGNYVVFYNWNPATNLPYDTITICIDYNNNGFNNCCNSFYSVLNGNWNLNWIKIQNITSIKEITPKIINNKIYDLSGKEINKPNGVYIKNNKLYYEQ